MSLKQYKAITPSQRQLVNIDRSDLWPGKPFKSLTEGKKKTGGRNNSGRITIWNRGGGHKQRYRTIDYKRVKYDVPAEVLRIEYDPNRSSFIALLRYSDGTHSYIIAPQRLSVGDTVISGKSVDIKPGNALPVKNIPIGTIVHNVETKQGKGAVFVRSAGAYAQIAGRQGSYTTIKLSSGELRSIKGDCLATVGAVSNPDHQNRSYGKAGRNRWLGKRPCVRGVAMNPIDHPHGGGEGRTSGGRHPVTPWGKPTKGKKTRTNKTTGQFILRKSK